MSYQQPQPRNKLLIWLGLIALALITVCGCLALFATFSGRNDSAPRQQAARPQPTATLEVILPTPPTITPIPAPTATPTPQPEPITLDGQGDGVINFTKWPGPAIVRATGNESSEIFAIVPYAGANRGSSLVNTTAPYQGLTALDFFDSKHTGRLEINASGPWRIEILPLTAARILQIPGEITGHGDDVIALLGEPDLATIKGNAAGRHLGIVPYGGQRQSSVVNTTDPYEGQVLIPRDAKYLEITAVGEWSIAITAP